MLGLTVPNGVAPHGVDQPIPSTEGSRQSLLLAHLPLVRSVVERMRTTLPSHLEADDLHSVGIVGLSLAVAKYDPAQESSFASYAAVRIRGAILDELRRMDWLSRGDRSKARQLTEAIGTLEQRLGRAPSTAEAAGALGLSAQDYAELLERVRPIVFVELDAGLSEEEDTPALHDLIPDDRGESALDRLQRKELVELLAGCIKPLPVMQQKVLAMYYFEELRLAEIAVVFGVTESRICQIHTKAVASLRVTLSSALAN